VPRKARAARTVLKINEHFQQRQCRRHKVSLVLVSLSEQREDDGQKSWVFFNEVNEEDSIGSNVAETKVGD
jgi:hypothetical protein